MVSQGATAVVLARVAWEPDGPLPRRLEPSDTRSIPRRGPAMQHIADSSARTLPDGSVCVRSPADPSSGAYVAVRIHGDTQTSLRLAPADAPTAGWRVIDAVGGPDGSWTVLESAPGPPDQVLVRRVGPDGTTVWQSGATAASPGSLKSLLVDGAANAYAVTAGDPPRLVKLDAGGEITDLRELAGAAGNVFMDGAGRVGFVEDDAEQEARWWVTIDVGTGESERLRLNHEERWGLDLPLGMAADGRPHGNRYGTIVRFDGDGRVDWELTVQDLVVDGRDVWAGWPTAEGATVEVLALAGDSAGQTHTFTPAVEDRPRRWRLMGHVAPDAFLLYTGGEGARTLVTDGSEQPTPAPEDVWLRSFELQVPTGPSVTDAGEIDLVTRGPDALYVVRLTPGP